MSTIKSQTEHLTLNADGSGKEIKFQCNGTEVAKIDSTGFVGAGSPSIDDNGNATAITIDSSENVGIGVVPESDWGSTLKVIQVDDSATFVGSENTTYVAQNWKMTDVGHRYIKSNTATRYYQDSGGHAFQVAPSGTADSAISWNTAMTIDNAGYVTMPKMATTYCRLKGPSSTGNYSNSFTAMQPVENPDSLYNSSNGRFTCPIDGLYFMNTMSINQTSYNNTTNAEPLKNGTEIPGGRMYASQSQNHTSGSATVLVRCSAGDYLQWRHSGSIYDNNHSNANFMLVHAE